MSVTLYVLDVDDFRPLAEVAAKLDDVDVVKRGPYYEVTSAASLVIDRNATGCRSAVWFSSIAAIRGGYVSEWDKAHLRIELGRSENKPTPMSAHPQLVQDETAADLARDVV